MSYHCKKCSFVTGSRKVIRKHAKEKHFLKGEDFDKQGSKVSAISNSYERRIE